MLKFQKILDFCQKPSFLLGSILFVFLLKGLVFALLIPVFQGSDEYIHYATVQHLAEPKDKTWPITTSQRQTQDTKDIPNYHFTDEIIAFSQLTESWNLSGEPHNRQVFDPALITKNEKEMCSGKYAPHISTYPPDIVTGTNLAHQIASAGEKLMVKKDFFFRYFTLRFLAIFYGIITLLCAYFIAIWSGIKKKHALLITGIIAFQPMFTATTAIINYDPLLIALFSLFLLCGTSILVHGPRYLNFLGLFLFALSAILTKGTGGILLILAIGLVIWVLRRYFKLLNRMQKGTIFLVLIALFVLLLFFSPLNYTSTFSVFKRADVGSALANYFSNNIFDWGKVERTQVTYWGTFGWLDTQIHPLVLYSIILIELSSFLGLLLLVLYQFRNWRPLQKLTALLEKSQKFLPTIFSRSYSKIKNNITAEKTFLPKPELLIFFTISTIILQLAIRFYDWVGIFSNGEGVGLPGRYFLPNIIPHFIFLATGFGAWSKNARVFEIILKIIFLLMVLLSLYAIFLIIIPRYYL
ncbi:MAG: phospholipid carrier-dependent glycosyltransferase [Candidatus Moraniibacteriota bacterium]